MQGRPIEEGAAQQVALGKLQMNGGQRVAGQGGVGWRAERPWSGNSTAVRNWHSPPWVHEVCP